MSTNYSESPRELKPLATSVCVVFESQHVWYYDQMTDVISDELTKALGITEELTVKKLAGNANDNYLLTLPSRKIVVKCLGEHTPENEQLEGIYRQYLLDNDLPVTPFLTFTNGMYVFTSHGLSYVALDYVEGEEAREKEHKVVGQVARLSAKLHKLEYETMPERVNWLNGKYVEHVITELQLASEEAEELRKQNSTFPNFWDESLPLGIVHGDLHLGNIIIDNTDHITTIIDWEEVGVVPIVLDIAGTVQSLAQTDEGFTKEVFDKFFEVYQYVRRLSQTEKDILEEAIRYRSFIVYVWALMKYKQRLMGRERYEFFKKRYYQEVVVPPVQ